MLPTPKKVCIGLYPKKASASITTPCGFQKVTVKISFLSPCQTFHSRSRKFSLGNHFVSFCCPYMLFLLKVLMHWNTMLLHVRVSEGFLHVNIHFRNQKEHLSWISAVINTNLHHFPVGSHFFYGYKRSIYSIHPWCTENNILFGRQSKHQTDTLKDNGMEICLVILKSKTFILKL